MPEGTEEVNSSDEIPRTESKCTAPELEHLNEVSERLREKLPKIHFHMFQQNGQRCCVRLGLKGSQVAVKGSEVFIARIPKDVFEDELVPLFNRVGEICEFRLMMDFCCMNRGYGFCRFSNCEDASQAVQELNNYRFKDSPSPLGVVLSKDNCRLYIRNIPKTMTFDDFSTAIQRLTKGVREVILLPCIFDRSKNRGFAFVEYCSHKEAAMARRSLTNSSGNRTIQGSVLFVDWAEPERDVDPDTMKTVKSIFVRNLSPERTSEYITKGFAHLAGVQPLHVWKNRDFAFVNFAERSQAELALNNASVPGKLEAFPLDKTLEVSWAKPQTDKYSMIGFRRDLRQHGTIAQRIRWRDHRPGLCSPFQTSLLGQRPNDHLWHSQMAFYSSLHSQLPVTIGSHSAAAVQNILFPQSSNVPLLSSGINDPVTSGGNCFQNHSEGNGSGRSESIRNANSPSRRFNNAEQSFFDSGIHSENSTSVSCSELVTNCPDDVPLNRVRCSYNPLYVSSTRPAAYDSSLPPSAAATTNVHLQQQQQPPWIFPHLSAPWPGSQALLHHMLPQFANRQHGLYHGIPFVMPGGEYGGGSFAYLHD